MIGPLLPVARCLPSGLHPERSNDHIVLRPRYITCLLGWLISYGCSQWWPFYLSPCSSAQANTAPSAPYTNPFLFPIGISSPLSSVRSIVPPGVYTYSVATLTLLSTYNTGLSNPTCLHPQPTQALQSPTLGSTLTYRLAPEQSFSEHSDLP